MESQQDIVDLTINDVDDVSFLVSWVKQRALYWRWMEQRGIKKLLSKIMKMTL